MQHISPKPKQDLRPGSLFDRRQLDGWIRSPPESFFSATLPLKSYLWNPKGTNFTKGHSGKTKHPGKGKHHSGKGKHQTLFLIIIFQCLYVKLQGVVAGCHALSCIQFVWRKKGDSWSNDKQFWRNQLIPTKRQQKQQQQQQQQQHL